MHFIDWIVLLIPMVVVVAIALKTRKYTRSVADFMSAGRVAGRYLVATATGEAGFGATSAVAQFELFFASGFTLSWWLCANNAIWLFILLSGFIIYRYRESRVMTLAQFFEIRYSKSFRVFAGALAFISGILAYGIYPAVGSRFFVYFCGLPDAVHCLGVQIPTFAIVMVVLLVPGVLLTMLGGQLMLMVVDCVEGIISMIFYFVVAIALLCIFKWSDISMTMSDRPAGQSLFNPFDAAATKDFNFWYMAILIFASAYGWQSQQSGHGFRSAALNAHEQKMGAILGPWRNEVRTLMLTVVCICAYCFMHHPHYAQSAMAARSTLAHIDSSALRTQMEVPVALGMLCPPVIRGMFASIMLFALVSADCSMMHSWGSIFVQDLVVPLRRKPMSTAQHLLLLRIAVLGVAIFAFFFSLWFKQSQYILMFLALARAVFSGAGAAIIGGFYWRKGTAAGAWGAMIGGAVISMAGTVLDKLWTPTLYPWLSQNAPRFLNGLKYLLEDVVSKHVPAVNWSVGPDRFPFNGQWILLFAILASIVLYVGLSLLTYHRPFNLERMLHRGRYAIPGDSEQLAASPGRFSLKVLIGITPQFTREDKAISLSLFAYRIAWFLIFVVVTIWNVWRPWPNSWWMGFWRWTSVLFPFALGIVITVWFTWGGFRDLRRLFVRLDQAQLNPLDNGAVATPIVGEPTQAVSDSRPTIAETPIATLKPSP